MSHPDKLHLILACDLEPDGKCLGPRSLSRCEGGTAYAERTGAGICVAATFSPDHPGQEFAMSTLMAAEIRSNTTLPVFDLEGDAPFNTRGEAHKFMRYADELDIPLEHRSVSSAWWHIKRVGPIFAQEFGPEVAAQIHFEPVAEDFPFNQRWREWMKRVHMQVPILRRPMEVTARKLGIRSSF